MNKCKLNIIVPIIFIFNLPIFGQVEDYFPLHKGDHWQYLYQEFLGPSFWDYKVVDIIDTMADSSTVYVVEQTGFPVVFYKIKQNDSAVIYWNYEGLNNEYFPFLKFTYNTNEAWQIDFVRWTSFNSKSIGTIWTVTDSVCEFYTSGDSAMLLVTYKSFYMKGIGFIYEDQEGGNSVSLLGCIVNGVKYGTIV
ncbi:MAG: hypothetical protein V1773_19185, partial [bacterium]